jgi:hypothetical protein
MRQTKKTTRKKWHGYERKFGHFVERFREDVKAQRRLLTSTKDVDADSTLVRANAVEVDKRLSDLHTAGSYVLIVLQEQKFEESDWGLTTIRNRYLKRAGPIARRYGRSR